MAEVLIMRLDSSIDFVRTGKVVELRPQYDGMTYLVYNKDKITTRNRTDGLKANNLIHGTCCSIEVGQSATRRRQKLPLPKV